MKATGIVRSVDSLGRFVLPKELRNTLGVNVGDQMEVYTDGDCIILRKYAPGCTFCGETADVTYVLNRPICPACLAKLQKQD